MGLREGTSLNWAGETQDPLAVYINSALGIGAPPETVTDDMLRHREYLRAKQPPPFPFPIDAALAAQGEAVWAARMRRLPRAGRRSTSAAPCRSTRSAPTASASTPGPRRTPTPPTPRRCELGVERKAMVKDVGYASQPLDGIWLRAPYLHNGSVPSLTALLMPPEARPAASGAAATSTTPRRSASAAARPTTTARGLFRFDTAERGNGNGGHLYGTDLPDADKAALIEYMKTL